MQQNMSLCIYPASVLNMDLLSISLMVAHVPCEVPAVCFGPLPALRASVEEVCVIPAAEGHLWLKAFNLTWVYASKHAHTHTHVYIYIYTHTHAYVYVYV